MRREFFIILIFFFSLYNLFAVAETNEKNSPTEIFKKAIQTLNEGDIEKAISLMEKLNLENKDYFEYLGYMYFVQGNYEKAVNLMEKVLSLDPNSVIAYIILGEIFYQQNEVVKAREIYLKLIKLAPEIKIAYIRLYELLKNNNPKEANKYYINVFRLSPIKIEKYLPKIEEVKLNISSKGVFSTEDIEIEKKLKVDEEKILKEFFSEKETNENKDFVLLKTQKNKKGLKLKFLTNPFSSFNKENFYVKLVEVIIVVLGLIINSLITRKKRERLKRIVVRNWK